MNPTPQNASPLAPILVIVMGFLVVTVGLLLLQPGGRERAETAAAIDRAETQVVTGPNTVTRDAHTPLDPLDPTPKPIADRLGKVTATPDSTPAALASVVARALNQSTPDNTRETVVTSTATTAPDLAFSSAPDDQRAATWDVLRALDTAKGARVEPGQPGSLLHATVARAVTEPGAVETSAENTPYLSALRAEADGATDRATSPQNGVRTYRVQPGDTLQSIAVKTLGNATRFQQIFEANRHLLNHADDLRAGQVLTLPVQ
ncbi:MAG: hypothetical protein CSA70_03060 [Rhodobacterales bacterium]|nr:MAG: hypothetical protein CSA70_03060 [Rhodobacterales bacterium]